MKQPFNTKRTFSSPDKIKIVVVIIFLAALLVILGFLVGLLLRQSGFRLSMLIPQSQVTREFPPTSVVPTLNCGTPTLVLGSETFQIQTITPTAEGSLAVPPDTSGIAYLVEGTDYVFVLSPTPQNMTVMSTLTAGTAATATWSNCDSTTYILSAPQQSSLSTAQSIDRSVPGLTLFFESDPPGVGVLFQSSLAEQAEAVIDTPLPDESGVLAEISLLETSTSPDGTTIQVGISILNYGQTAFTVSSDVISLTQPDGAVLPLESSKPRLPEGIRPGNTKTLELTFPRPASSTATLKIFTVEYDIEGY